MHPQGPIFHRVAAAWRERLAQLPQILAGAGPRAVPPAFAEGILSSPSPAFAGPWPFEEERLYNSGGPRSRTRTELIVRSLFADRETGKGLLGTRPVGELQALHLGDRSSKGQESGFRHAASEALKECGFASPDAAFEAFADLPRRALHARVVPERDDASGAKNPRDDLQGFLKTALVLGKCSQGLYDPSRPVIWTENRLGQWVELHEIGKEFYDEED